MARVTGLEPATSGVTGRHSNRLSYTRVPQVSKDGAFRRRRTPGQADWRTESALLGRQLLPQNQLVALKLETNRRQSLGRPRTGIRH